MDLIGILIADRLEHARVIFADILVLGGAGIDAHALALDVLSEILERALLAVEDELAGIIGNREIGDLLTLRLDRHGREDHVELVRDQGGDHAVEILLDPFAVELCALAYFIAEIDLEP